MRMPGIGIASPSKSLSTPAMIFSTDDFPAPFSPSRPILAPGWNESEMFLRICRLGGTTFPTRIIVYTNCAIGIRCFQRKGGSKTGREDTTLGLSRHFKARKKARGEAPRAVKCRCVGGYL